MRATLFVPFVFGVALLAQDPLPGEAARTELAQVLAVEEQERDLAKAEALYREALAGTQLSAAARALANQRLAALLTKLGRADEAKPFAEAANAVKGVVAPLDDVTGGPQDREREAALRAKARELVQRVQQGELVTPGGGPLPGIPPEIAEELLWIGAAAVPVVTATLEQEARSEERSQRLVVSLAQFLWRVGGPQAAAFLTQALAMEGIRRDVALAAEVIDPPELLPVAEAYLRSGHPDVIEAILRTKARHRLAPGLLVDVLARGSVDQRIWLLQWAPSLVGGGAHRELAGHEARLLGVAREALASTDPAFAGAGRDFLRGALYVQVWTAGLELLLEHLPSPVFAMGQLQVPDRGALQVDAARHLLPRLDACVRAIGPARPSDSRRGWIEATARRIVAPLGTEVVPFVLGWVDLGYDLVELCEDRVTGANAGELWARFDRLHPNAQVAVLGMLEDVDLPPELFPAMRATADALAGPGWALRFALPLARTGNPDAAGWLVAQRERMPEGSRDRSAEVFAKALVVLGRRSAGTVVRTAMREYTVSAFPPGSQHRAPLLLALLSMHDEASIELALDGTLPPAPHPYAAATSPPPITPLQYLLDREPDPPHGFTEAELLPWLRRAPQWERTFLQSPNAEWERWRRATDAAVMALAEHSESQWGSSQPFRWQRFAAARIADEAGDGPWHRWLERTLASSGPARWVFTHLGAEDLTRLRPQLDALIAGDDPVAAVAALTALERHDLPLDLEPLWRSPHEELASQALQIARKRGTLPVAAAIAAIPAQPEQRSELADYLGGKLDLAAVPALLHLLADPEQHVRERAAEALTRIRFYHEQQAHWDRVLKGLDASPASAAEKLLLQARPGAPQAQRLLAITSLGALRAPEALPFLIEWSQEADPDIAARAKDAITRIHLGTRK